MARTLACPVVVVASSVSRYTAAALRGLDGIDPDIEIAGLLLTDVTDTDPSSLEAQLAAYRVPFPLLGVIPRRDGAALPRESDLSRVLFASPRGTALTGERFNVIPADAPLQPFVTSLRCAMHHPPSSPLMTSRPMNGPVSPSLPSPSVAFKSFQSSFRSLPVPAPNPDIAPPQSPVPSRRTLVGACHRITALAAAGSRARPPPAPRGSARRSRHPPKVRIAVAADAAFWRYQCDNLRLLEAHGAELVPFSPLADSSLPEDVHVVYVGSGPIREHLGVLSGNATMRATLAAFAQSGGVVLAEGAGMTYLSEWVEVSADGTRERMCGVLPVSIVVTGRSTCGYVEVVTRSNPLFQAGSVLRGFGEPGQGGRALRHYCLVIVMPCRWDVESRARILCTVAR